MLLPRIWFLIIATLLTSIAAFVWPPLCIVACLFFCWRYLTHTISPLRPENRVWLILFIALLSVGCWRFVTEYALLGIQRAGLEAAQKSALYRLRELRQLELFAMRDNVYDYNMDGRGDPLALDQLAARQPLPNGRMLDFPRLQSTQSQWRQSNNKSILVINGYAFWIYTDTSILGANAPTFIIYAWPIDGMKGPLWIIDNRDRIFHTVNSEQLTLEDIPRLDAAWLKNNLTEVLPLEQHDGNDGRLWKPWKNKQPLPET